MIRERARYFAARAAASATDLPQQPGWRRGYTAQHVARTLRHEGLLRSVRHDDKCLHRQTSRLRKPAILGAITHQLPRQLSKPGSADRITFEGVPQRLEAADR